MTIVLWRDHFNAQYDRTYRWAAMRKEDHDNMEPEHACGHGAEPMEAVEDLFWRLDIEDLTPEQCDLVWREDR